MSPPDRGPRRPHGPPGQDANEQLPWSIVYYQAPDGTVPALEFLDGCPGTIDAQFTAVLDAVAAAPPPRFSGGGKWEAMHGTMGGWYEIRLTGPGREQLRLFCLLENGTSEELARRGLSRPANQVELVVHAVTKARFSGPWRRGSRRSGGAGTGSFSACWSSS